MICQQVFSVSKKTANHLANVYALEYNREGFIGDNKMNYQFYGWERALVPAINKTYQNIETPRDLYDILSGIWCADTCAPRMRQNWSSDNKTLGQCSITAFLAQDIFGGRVYGIPREDGNFHCYNVVGDCVFDLTSEQFGSEVLSYKDNPEQFREVHFAKKEKMQRYELLKDMLLARTNEEKKMHRCGWEGSSPKMTAYHDRRWCKAEHRESELFAMLVLEGMQAGLSWSTIIEKEEAFREAFDGFDPKAVAEYGEEKILELMQNPGIIRNRLKINAAVANAKAFLKVQEEFGSFDSYIWSFTEGKVIDHHLKSLEEMPATSELSEKISRDLKKRGFKFVGATIIYSYLQGIGIINDHLDSCDFR